MWTKLVSPPSGSLSLLKRIVILRLTTSTTCYVHYCPGFSSFSVQLPIREDRVHDKMPVIPVAAMAIAAQNRRLYHSMLARSLTPGVTPVGAHFANTSLPHTHSHRRTYAKGRDKVKSGKGSVVIINEAEINQVGNYLALKTSLERQVELMKEDFVKNLNIRGAAAALELLEIEFEGETFPLQELAQIGRKNPQLIVLNFASLPDAIKPSLDAILNSGMGLNPQQDGTTLFVQVPKVTREHRENLAKNAKSIFVKTKTGLQDVQNRFIRQTRGHPEASEDLIFSVTKQIMKLTESYIIEAEKLMVSKQKELLENN